MSMAKVVDSMTYPQQCWQESSKIAIQDKVTDSNLHQVRLSDGANKSWTIVKSPQS